MSTPAGRAAKEALVAEARRDGSGGSLVAVQASLLEAVLEVAGELRELRRVLEPVAAEPPPGPERREYMDLSQLRDSVGEDQADEPDPWDLLQVGDEALARHCLGICGDQRGSGDQRGRFICNRPVGHTGQHVAVGAGIRTSDGGRRVLQVWPTEPEHVHEWTRPHGEHGARQCATCREVTL